MNRILLVILLSTVTIFCCAQRIKVHQGNNINSFLLSDVDSITHDGNETVTVYFNSHLYEFTVDNVDSLSINSEMIECHNIISEQLNGWDEGIFAISNNEEDFYIVSKTDSDEDGKEMVIVSISSFSNENLDEAVNFIFDIDGNLQEIVTAGYQFKAYKNQDEFNFIVYKNNEYVGSFNVACEVIHGNGSDTSVYGSRRKSPFFNSIGEISLPKISDFAGKAGRLLNGLGDALGFVTNLDEGKYGEVLLDFVVGGTIGLADLPLIATVLTAEGIKSLLKYFYEQDKRRLLGDAQIEITSVKRTSETAITVEGTISNVSSIPPIIIVGSDVYNPKYNAYIKDISNTVYWGIAEGKSGQPGMHRNDNSSGTLPITDGNFSYTFYLDRVPGQVLYFRPFLAPEISMQSIYSCIRYGERKEFVDTDVKLSNFKQIECNHKEDGTYSAIFTIDGSISGLFQELSGWGFEVKTKTGSFRKRFDAKENVEDYYPPLEKSFTCDVTFNSKDIEDYDIEKIAEISITPYISFWNSVSPLFLDEKKYTITISDGFCPDSNHPHWIDLGLPSGTLWRCCNEGASKPEEYGGYYAFGQVATAPSLDQIEELLNYCRSKWTTLNGVYGRQFTSKKNGGVIFLPAAGDVSDGDLDSVWYGELRRVGSDGFYWSSTPNGEFSAYFLYFHSGKAVWNYLNEYNVFYYYFYNGWNYSRLIELSVRPVR